MKTSAAGLYEVHVSSLVHRAAKIQRNSIDLLRQVSSKCRALFGKNVNIESHLQTTMVNKTSERTMETTRAIHSVLFGNDQTLLLLYSVEGKTLLSVNYEQNLQQ